MQQLSIKSLAAELLYLHIFSHFSMPRLRYGQSFMITAAVLIERSVETTNCRQVSIVPSEITFFLCLILLSFSSHSWDKPILLAWGVSDKYLPQSVAEGIPKKPFNDQT